MDVFRRPTRLFQVLLVLVPVGLAGCAAMHGTVTCWPWCDHAVKGDVCQVMALWADGLVEHPDPMNHGTPTQGFAARVYLFGPGLGEPLAADGSFSIRLYDGAGPATPQDIPLEIWNIDPANLERVLSKDGLGWGYDLWLPWRTQKPTLQRGRLMVQYTSAQGKVAWSAAADLVIKPQRSVLKTTTECHTAPCSQSRLNSGT